MTKRNDAAGLIASLSPEKRALLARKLQQQAHRQGAPDSIPRRKGARVFQPSFTQQQMWFAEQLFPGSPVSNRPGAVRISGPIAAPALQEALNAVIRRHAILRARLVNKQGMPMVEIEKQLGLKIAVVDLEGMAENDRNARISSLYRQEAQQPFDLQRGPLVRARLVRLGAREHLLFLVFHHSVYDAWSMEVLLQELVILCEAEEKKVAAGLPALPIQYSDYAAWYREQVETGKYADQLYYWKRTLANTAPVALPTDFPRPVVQTSHGASYLLEVPGAVARSLRQLARQENVTLFILLLGVFQVLLQRYTDQDDITVASPVAGRTQLELEKLIGVFINTLLFRSQVSGSESFRQHLARVRNVAMEAYSNQAFPHDRVVEALRPERDLSRNPLFQVMFQLRKLCAVASDSGRLRMEEVRLDSGIALVDVVLDVVDSGNELQCLFVYNTDLFEASRIERLGKHYLALLEGVVADPECRISALPMLSAAERRRLLVDWNATERRYPREQGIHALFEQQVERAERAVAVEYQGRRLSYGELNDRADRLAAYLRAGGVGDGTLVGLCVERSPEMVVGMLGILKAGGAYVPLDPEYPPARLALMLEDTAAPVLLTQARLQERLPGYAGKRICLDSDWERIATEPLTRASNVASAQSLAYVIYTSGSTGRPKGVMIEHRSVVNYISDICERFALTADDRVLQFASFSFDGSVEEIFASLLSGATLVIRDDAMLDSAARFVQCCGELELTTLHLPTAYWQDLVSQLREELGGLPPSLRLLIIGGEKASRSQCRVWKQYANPRIQLINSYGPTEATVAVTICDLTRDWSDADGREPAIGRPVSNTRVYILDRYRQPVPVGVPGELYISGDCLARGYLDRDDLTAQRFIPNPFSNDPASRMYITGDRVCYLASGDIAFLGRSDKQIKIRGYRIEPGEIESVLNEHAAIRASVVLANEDGAGERQLVAYLLCDPSQEPTVSTLRAYLKESLPQYMVPAVFCMLDEFPLNASGKLDLGALTARQRSRPDQDAAYQAPATELEVQLTAIWSEVLDVDRIGVQDDFFDLGGHSLLATQVVSRILTQHRVELSLQVFFEAPTIAALAKRIEMAGKTGSAGATVALEKMHAPAEEEAYEFPASFAQQRLWFLDRLVPGSSLYNITAALRLRGRLDVTALEQSIRGLVQRHESLQTVFAEHDGQPVQLILPGIETAMSVRAVNGASDQSREEELQALIREEADRPFDIASGPLLRATLLHLNDDDQVLLLVVHHIVFDGWSIGILFAELSELYAATVQKRAARLESLPIQYADYAVWQRETLQGEFLERQLRYWKEQLADLPLTELPPDRPRPAIGSHRGARYALSIPATVVDSIERLARQQGVTLFMLMLAVFQLLLQRYTDRDDIVVGSPVAGRNRPELEGLIGFFVNTLVLRADLSGDPSFRELLTRVKTMTLAAYSHQEFPFEKLVEELRPARDLSRNPLFQIMFVLQNTPAGQLAMPGLEIERLKPERSSAKFDISVQFTPGRNGLRGAITYNTDLFEASRIERLGKHYLALLEGVVADPECRISALPMLSAAERRRLLVDWNATERRYPREQGIHALFEQQVERAERAVAVEYQGRRLSYGELNDRADRLAAYLRAGGVGDGTLVGLCVERSPEMVVGMLGILKAGGAYVPLDPEYPPARLALMLEDTAAPVLLTQARLQERLPGYAGKRICLDSDWERIATEPLTRASNVASAQSLAYVIYTSGSTGRPKGVCVPHCAVNRLVINTDYVRLGPDDRIAQVSNISFDAATFEIWGALLCGGALHIIDRDVFLSPKTFAATLRAQGITTLFLTTALFNEYAREVPDAFRSLRQVLFGGEKVDPRSVKAVLDAAPPQRLLHVYGPTENTTFTSWYEVKSVDQHAVTLPIGQAIANTRLYVLDNRLNPVAAGVQGELYIGGDGLACGYLNRDELTAKAFVAGPFAECPDQRLYRTGDLVRYVDERVIEFTGRVDQQIKLRGFRIEPGEIETVLQALAGVQDAIVLMREDRPGDKRLVAYLVIDEERTGIQAIRSKLKQQLPEYMLPSAIVMMDRLPLSANGKVDRNALPKPAQAAAPAPLCVPKDYVELELAKLWRQALGITSVDVSDNFFELGGYSLLGVQLLAEVEKKFGRSLPLAALFEHPTIVGMAVLLRGGEWSSRGKTIVAVQPDGARPPLFCVHGRADLLAKYLGRDQPLYWLHHAQEGANADYTGIEAVATAHIEDMRKYQQHGPYYLGGYSFGGVVAFEMARQLQQAGEQVAMLALIDPTSPGGYNSLGKKVSYKKEKTVHIDL